MTVGVSFQMVFPPCTIPATKLIAPQHLRRTPISIRMDGLAMAAQIFGGREVLPAAHDITERSLVGLSWLLGSRCYFL